jgi:hypothetical protein
MQPQARVQFGPGKVPETRGHSDVNSGMFGARQQHAGARVVSRNPQILLECGRNNVPAAVHNDGQRHLRSESRPAKSPRFHHGVKPPANPRQKGAVRAETSRPDAGSQVPGGLA